MRITSSAFTKVFAVLTACGLFACAGEGDVGDEPVTEHSSTEPTLFSDDSPTAVGKDDSVRGTHDLDGRASGAMAQAISHNHSVPHALVIPATALIVRRGGTFALTPGGSAFGETHKHDIALTPTQLAEIADGALLTVESTVAGPRGGHTHFVTIARR